MQQYQDSVTHANGTPVAGASIRVLTAAGAQATIYSDNGVTVAANPIKAGANGQFSFYAADGNYTLVISAVGHVTRTLTGIVLDSLGSSASLPVAAVLDGTESVTAKQAGGVVQTTLAKIATFVLSIFSILIAAGPGAVARTILARLGDLPVSIRDFGAKLDGVTDDAPAINAALAYVASIGGGVLVDGGPGVALLKSNLHVGANTHIRFSKNTIIRRGAYIGRLLANDLGVTLSIGGYNGNSNIIIEGGIWDCNGQNFYSATNCFEIGYARNVKLLNLTAMNLVRAHCLDLSASRDVEIAGCRFLGYASDPNTDRADTLGADRTYVEAVQLDHNVQGSFSYGALDRTIDLNITFRNNYVGPNPDNTDPRFGSFGAGIGGHGAVANAYQTGVKVIGNYFDQCGFAAVRAYKWVDVVVQGNTFNACVRGVHITPVSPGQDGAIDANGVQTNLPQCGSRYKISGNDFVGITDIGVFIAAPTFVDTNYAKVRHVTITGNNFEGVTNAAIDARWASYIAVSGNTFNSVKYAMQMRFCDNVTFSGNTADNVATNFFYVYENTETTFGGQGLTSNITVSGNIAKNIGSSGINIGGPATGFTITGNLLSAVSMSTGTGQGITANSSAKNGHIAGNRVMDAGAALKNPYGVQVTSTCSNVTVGANDVFGATASYQIQGATNSMLAQTQQVPKPVTGSTYTQTAQDAALVFNGTAAQTVTLLSPAAVPGQILNVKNIAAFAVNSASANVVPLGSATAGTAILAAGPGKWALLQSDGTNWITLMAN
jgi:polygalacturonase